jgi:hypothetical protein
VKPIHSGTKTCRWNAVPAGQQENNADHSTDMADTGKSDEK